MEDVYRYAKALASYDAIRFHEMLVEYKGRETANRLLEGTEAQSGFTAMYLKGKLDLTMEAVIYDNPDFHRLFSEKQLETIIKRLKDYKYLK